MIGIDILGIMLEETNHLGLAPSAVISVLHCNHNQENLFLELYSQNAAVTWGPGSFCQFAL